VSEYIPTVLREGHFALQDLNRLRATASVRIVDVYEEQIKEYLDSCPDEASCLPTPEQCNRLLLGDWIYYPWNNLLLHTVNQQQNMLLRTDRNQYLITRSEQLRLASMTIAIAGLSVGSNTALALAHTGIGETLKVADFDVLETTNLNRTPYGLADVGQRKTDLLRKRLLEFNPYVRILSYDAGLSEDNVGSFIGDTPKASIIVELLDDLRIKILLREVAKKNRVPVLTVTSIHDRVLLDVERYDLEPELCVFNGLVPSNIISEIRDGLSRDLVNKYAIQIVHKTNISPKTMASLDAIGTSLHGRPQLMSTVEVAAGIAVQTIRRIGLGDEVESGRTVFDI